MELLRIKDWRARYEISQGRKVRTLTWVAEPNGAEHGDLDLSRRKLLKLSGGLPAWGVYELLIKVTSRLPGLTKGWAKTKTARLWHYFAEGRSLCLSEEFAGSVNDSPKASSQAEICSDCWDSSKAIELDPPDLPTRGYLSGGDRPWSASDLELMIDVDAPAITAALGLLTRPAIDLIERLDPRTFKLLDGDSGALWNQADSEHTPRPLPASRSVLPETSDSDPGGATGSVLGAGSESAPSTGQYTHTNTTGQDRKKEGETIEPSRLEGVQDRLKSIEGNGEGSDEDRSVPDRESPGSAVADRNEDRRPLQKMKWVMAVEPLWGLFKTGEPDKGGEGARGKHPRDSTQWKRDRTSSENLFKQLWPEDQETRPEVFDWALDQVPLAGKNGDTPMAWLRSVINGKLEGVLT